MSEQKDRPAAMLPYASGIYTPRRLLKAERIALVVSAIIGFAAGGFVSSLIYIETWLMRLIHHGAAPPLEPLRTIMIVATVAGVLLVAVGLDWRRAVVRRAQTSERRFPYVQGFIIGLGVSCMVFGACASGVFA